MSRTNGKKDPDFLKEIKHIEVYIPRFKLECFLPIYYNFKCPRLALS